MPPRRLVEYPVVLVNVACGLCPRRGRYRLARLAERYGAGALLDDVLRTLANGCGPGCGARFADLPEPTPAGTLPAVTGVILRRHGPPREILPPRRRD